MIEQRTLRLEQEEEQCSRTHSDAKKQGLTFKDEESSSTSYCYAKMASLQVLITKMELT